MRSRGLGRVRGVTLRVACAQLRARPVAHARAALSDILAAIREAKKSQADLLVLPECSYPGYVLLSPHPYRRRIPSDAEALTAIAGQARRHKMWTVVGIARTHKGMLRNEAVLIDRDGTEVGSYAKMRLWNFDRRWFTAGTRAPVFATPFGRLGMMICADGRNPEIARTLVASGAQLIADPTAWVGFGSSHDRIRNVQADYMLRVRSLENGVCIAAADKCGSELGAVHYAGRSQITAADGSVVAVADAITPQLICARITVAAPRPFVVSLPAAARKTLRLQQRSHANGRVYGAPRFWIGIYQSAPRKPDPPDALAAIEAQSVHALVRTGLSVAAAARSLRGVKGLRFAIFSGTEMLAPEPARAASLRGADILVWMKPPGSPLLAEVARTRAVENRVFVALCSRTTDSAPACIINPDGGIAATALAGVPSGFVAVVDTTLSRRKEVVPGTQTFSDRVPQAYRWLDKARGVLVP